MTVCAQPISTGTYAKLYRRTLIFDVRSPDKLACDTTLRRMPDGSWVMASEDSGRTLGKPVPAPDRLHRHAGGPGRDDMAVPTQSGEQLI